MKRKITTGTETREALLRGADKLCAAVRTVIGPQGRSVLLSGRVGAPDIGHRAGTVAKQLRFADVTENAGAILLRSAGEKTAERAGDGAARAMLLAGELMHRGNRLIAAGCSPVSLRRGLERCIPVLLEALRAQAVTASDGHMLAALASVAAGDKALGALVAGAFEQVGPEGYVAVKASDTEECRLERVDAFTLERGWSSRHMATDTVSQETVFEDAAVFVCETPLSSIYDMLPLLNEVSLSGERLLVLADSVADEVIRSFVSNIAQGAIRICSVSAPGVGQARRDWLADTAAYTGAAVFGTVERPDLKQARLSDCGRAGRVVVTRDSTRIENGRGGELLERRLKQLRTLQRLEHNELEDEQLRRRIANLSGETAVLRIGAVTESERRALSAQAEGALRAVFDAARNGLVPGGGVAFLRAGSAVRRFAASLPGEERAAGELLADALEAPCALLAANAGHAPGPVLAALKTVEGPMGFDVLTGEITDLLAAGIVDSLGSTIAAAETGVGLAAQFLTVDAAVLIDGTPVEDLPVPDDLNLSPSDFV